jgi:glycosyltransferase involved in cell wall biosynthesis/peptidoglycan/xylan/chitin deacetylase (PgdA/CDA1 family)
MLLNKLYYATKPVLPWALRTALRRHRADSRRKAYADVWPIDEKAAAAPPGWPGWPEGKRFALVLTHDVEGTRGLDRVDRLVKLEAGHGFRSSFNLVPEEQYRVPDALRELLVAQGFEVGVHGLNHDGKLYSTKAGFARKAVAINGYLRQWNACGFRSPSMQHRLDWLHKLNLIYDCSTFDTDPFEPEPDGAGTIFPFWVPNPQGSGYVELPYTLVQDYTLFVILREKNIDIWKQKLDWIAAHGGMALINTHPDYMAFDGGPARDEYPVSHYEDFLSYAREKYEGSFWQACPCDVARFYTSQLPPSLRNTRKKVCMLAYSQYETDSRVRHYAETLARRGDMVDVIAIGNGATPRGAEISGVSVYRVQDRKNDERSKWTYAWRMARFLLTSSAFLSRRHDLVRYDLVHIHNIPDFLVFGAWYAKWNGAKLILDIHDVVPEQFESKFGAKPESSYTKLLKWIEKRSAGFVDHVIVANHLWHEKLVARSIAREKCSVFLNHIDPAIFHRRPHAGSDGKIVLMFPGSFQWHQGLDIAIEALANVRTRAQNAELHLYGSGRMEDELRRLSDRLGLNGAVQFHPSVPLDDMPGIMANADLGVVPKRADNFGNEAYSTKIMEFMAVGVPVVASRTKIDTYYFDDRVVRFFPSGDPRAMADTILELIQRPDLREAQVTAAYQYVARNNWDVRKKDYLELVDSLTVEKF